MDTEVQDQERLQTWVKISEDEAGHEPLIPMRWVFAYKVDPQGYIIPAPTPTRQEATNVHVGSKSPFLLPVLSPAHLEHPPITGPALTRARAAALLAARSSATKLSPLRPDTWTGHTQSEPNESN